MQEEPEVVGQGSSKKDPERESRECVIVVGMFARSKSTLGA